MALGIGIILENRYLIKDILGQGGMGTVYLAEDQRLDGRPVAVKEMLIQVIRKEDMDNALKQFKQEATMLAKLSHSNLPKVIDFFDIDGKQYLIMEYIKGKTFKQLIEEKEGPFSEEECIEFGLHICSALEYLHSQEPPIVFRDLKPQNIILTDTSEVKLIDFGIAKIFNSTDNTDPYIHARGTMGYCPPEQCSSRGNTDHRADVYALGANLHYFVTNRNPADLPFVFPLLREIRPESSEEFEKILSRALAMDCEERFNSIKQFKEELEKLKNKKFHNSIGVEEWISKWWATVAITISLYSLGLIKLYSLLIELKPYLGYFPRFLIMFIYLLIPIIGLISYIRTYEKRKKRKKIAD